MGHVKQKREASAPLGSNDAQIWHMGCKYFELVLFNKILPLLGKSFCLRETKFGYASSYKDEVATHNIISLLSI